MYPILKTGTAIRCAIRSSLLAIHPSLLAHAIHFLFIHAPDAIQRPCTYSLSAKAPNESSAGRASRCIAMGTFGSLDLAL